MDGSVLDFIEDQVGGAQEDIVMDTGMDITGVIGMGTVTDIIMVCVLAIELDIVQDNLPIMCIEIEIMV